MLFPKFRDPPYSPPDPNSLALVCYTFVQNFGSKYPHLTLGPSFVEVQSCQQKKQIVCHHWQASVSQVLL